MMKEPTLSAGNVGPGASGYPYALVNSSIWWADNRDSMYVYNKFQRHTRRKIGRLAKVRESTIGRFVTSRRPYRASYLS